ncbi:MAG: AAA family ATPase [Rhizobacter sp.]|nr:AAA family ATPase [Rhizobacter sp.]
MLTRIEIDGFKTFENFSTDLAPFVVILGTNAAGKSNLFDAIQLLSNLASQDVSEAVKGMRGEPLELFRRTGAGRSSRLKFAVEVLLDPVVRDPWGSEVKLVHTRLRYEVVLERREIRPGLERVQVAHESATPIFRVGDQWASGLKPTPAFRKRHLKYSRKKPLLTTESQETGLNFNIHQDGKQGRVRPASAAEATVLSSISNAEFPHLFALREELRTWRLLQLDPALLRRPSPVIADDLLAPDGANLAAVLARIKAETLTAERPNGALSDIAADLNALIPGVKSLDAQLDKSASEYRVDLTMRDGLPFSSRVVSDGTLRVLALLTLLHDPRHRGLVCFEEPENGVHPARLKQLVRRLQGMVTRPDDLDQDDDAPLTQLLLNSHSPVVLSALIGLDFRPLCDPILFADTASVVDPAAHEVRRHTRLRAVMTSPQDELLARDHDAGVYVSRYEVERLLNTASAEA